jgi:ribosomal protein L7/L12
MPSTLTEQNIHIGDLQLRISALERKVDFLLTALKLDYQEPPEPAFMTQVRALAAQHKTLDAIKVYRENTACSLEYAKEAIAHL